MAAPTGEPVQRLTGSPRVGVVVVNWQRPRGDARVPAGAVGDVVPRAGSRSWSTTGARTSRPTRSARRAPDAEYVRSAANLGFAGGSNLGMRAALARGADWVWFLNDDAAARAGARWASCSPRPSGRRARRCSAPRSCRPAQPERLDSVALDVDLAGGRVRLLGHDEVDRGQYDGLREPLAVTGCALLVRARRLRAPRRFRRVATSPISRTPTSACARAPPACRSPPCRARACATIARPRRAAASRRRASTTPAAITSSCSPSHAPQPAWRSRLRSAAVLVRYSPSRCAAIRRAPRHVSRRCAAGRATTRAASRAPARL